MLISYIQAVRFEYKCWKRAKKRDFWLTGGDNLTRYSSLCRREFFRTLFLLDRTWMGAHYSMRYY